MGHKNVTGSTVSNWATKTAKVGLCTWPWAVSINDVILTHFPSPKIFTLGPTCAATRTSLQLISSYDTEKFINCILSQNHLTCMMQRSLKVPVPASQEVHHAVVRLRALLPTIRQYNATQCKQIQATKQCSGSSFVSALLHPIDMCVQD